MSGHTGRCLCGAVTFAVAEFETDHHVCNCEMCRYWAGSPPLVASAEGVFFTGDGSIDLLESSDWAERGSCKNCGFGLFYRLKESGGYHIPVGLFDNQSAFKVKGEIFIDRKPPGYDFAGDHPRLNEAETFAMFEGS